MNKFAFVLIGVFFLSMPIVHAQEKSAAEHLIDGNDLFKVKNLDAAIYEYSKALEINPNLAKAYNNRGVAYAQENSFDRAIADFTMAIANKSDDEEAYNNRGHAYEQKGNLVQAMSDYSRAIEINPIYIKAYNNRGLLFLNMKNYDKAWDDVFKIEEIGGSVDPFFYGLLKKATVPHLPAPQS